MSVFTQHGLDCPVSTARLQAQAASSRTKTSAVSGRLSRSTATLIGVRFLPSSAVRPAIWIAFIWMGVACILNARRCGRTHCRYTGPYYLAMIAPVFLLASGIDSARFYDWLILGTLILAGSGAIWWATEYAWGKFSS